MTAVAAVLLPTLAVWLALRRALPPAVAAALAPGLGLGVAACGFFLWFPLAGKPGAGYATAESLAAGAVIVAALRWRRPADTQPWDARRLLAGNALALVFLPAAAVALSRGLAYVRANPHSVWDAAGFWNHRARCLFRADSASWRDAFDPANLHPDYPLALPATVARLWLALGDDPPGVPAAVSLAVAALTVALLVALVNRARPGAGWLAGLVLVATPSFARWGAMQFADILLGYFALAAVGLVSLSDRAGGGRRGLLVPAGLAAGLAAWTKNEGALFLLAAASTRAAVTWRRGAMRAAAREAAWLLAGAALPLLTALYFKLALAPPNDVVAGQAGGSTLDRIADPGRYAEVLAAFAGQAWALGPGFVLAVGAYALLVGRAPPADRSRHEAWPWLACLTLLELYAAVYVVTPHDLAWHLRTSLDRLLLHVWPALLFAAFAACRSPLGNGDRGARSP